MLLRGQKCKSLKIISMTLSVSLLVTGLEGAFVCLIDWPQQSTSSGSLGCVLPLSASLCVLYLG